MKITLIENDKCFAFQMDAETMADAALLVRFGTNHVEKFNSVGVCAHADGKFSGHVVIGKHKKADGYLQRRR